MTRKLIAGAVLLFGLALGIIVFPTVAQAQGNGTQGEEAATAITLYRANLLPENEVPPVTGTNASGKSWIILDTETNMIAYAVGVMNPSSAVGGAHIHTGTAGTNGPIVVDLLGKATLTPDAPLFGLQTISAAVAQDLGSGGYYVNVHTAMHQGGEMRGQIEAVTMPLRIGSILKGVETTPTVTTTASGRAIFELSADLTELNYTITISDVQELQTVGIYIGAVDPSAEPAITIPTSGEPVMQGTVPISQEQLAALLLDNMFLNIGTTAYPQGELQGQILEGYWLNAPHNYYFPIVGREAQGGTSP